MELELHALRQAADNKNQQIARAFIKAAEITHTVVIAAKCRTKQIEAAIATQDKSVMWNALQEHIHPYIGFINSTTTFTGFYVIHVGLDFYEKMTTADIENQLQLLIGFIYCKEAVNCAARETYRECLKRILRSSGLLNDKELEILSRLS